MKLFGGILLVTLFTYSIQTTPIIHVPAYNSNLNEGDEIIFTVYYGLHTDCTIFRVDGSSTAESADYTLSGEADGNQIDPVSFNVDHTTVTYTLSVAVDGDSDEFLTLRTECGAEFHPFTFNLFSNPGGNGDPHFNQYILNRLNNETTNICYDVTAEKNQYIKIFSQPKLETELFGQLKDDYYMHKMILKVKNHLIKIDVFNMNTENMVLKWNDTANEEWMESNEMLFRKHYRVIEIKRHKDDDLTFEIIRRKDSLNKYYLDVALRGLKTDYTGMDGLLGRVGNNKISVYQQVQALDVSGRTTVLVNGLKTFGYEQIRNGKICTLVKVDDILHPQKLTDFILKDVY